MKRYELDVEKLKLKIVGKRIIQRVVKKTIHVYAETLLEAQKIAVAKGYKICN